MQPNFRGSTAPTLYLARSRHNGKVCALGELVVRAREPTPPRRAAPRRRRRCIRSKHPNASPFEGVPGRFIGRTGRHLLGFKAEKREKWVCRSFSTTPAGTRPAWRRRRKTSGKRPRPKPSNVFARMCLPPPGPGASCAARRSPTVSLRFHVHPIYQTFQVGVAVSPDVAFPPRRLALSRRLHMRRSFPLHPGFRTS